MLTNALLLVDDAKGDARKSLVQRADQRGQRRGLGLSGRPTGVVTEVGGEPHLRHGETPASTE